MRETKVRFSASTYDRLLAEAQKEGVPVAQYVRELVIVHLARLPAQTGDKTVPKKRAP